MPGNDLAVERPLPRFVTFFAPWLWFSRMRPWKRWTLALVLFVGAYIEFPVVIIPFMHTRKGLPAPIEQAFSVVWYPIDRLIQTSSAVASFYCWQADLVLRLLGWFGI